MDKRINDILSSTEEKKHLMKCLEIELKESNMFNDITEQIENYIKEGKSEMEICNAVTNFVYENLPNESKCYFFEEVDKVIENFVLPKLNE